MLQAHKAKEDAVKRSNTPLNTPAPPAPKEAAPQRTESLTQATASGSACVSSSLLNNDSQVIKPLDQIIRLDKVAGETADTIGKIWTDYHANKDVLSAVIPADSYRQLYRRSKLYPRFVFPVPHGEGMEVYYAQFHFHQCFFTPLLEFKTHGESAKPYLTLTHYIDLLADKGIVLMRGERTDSKTPLSMTNAQYLALALQQFYLIGSEAKQKLVEDFNVRPHEFDFERVVAEANKLD
ncbi:hypothetical protein H4R34_003024 [Dimargaris verticillata]|uniref:ATP11-domain-containing protein n=1 Tax=Dimargaris verticillata TaxID=2761393 RepID=A0A9W8ED10_9FUNG|nr:hypothetical protein H4R34_003024 [Dimargaris verticillata]